MRRGSLWYSWECNHPIQTIFLHWRIWRSRNFVNSKHCITRHVGRSQMTCQHLKAPDWTYHAHVWTWSHVLCRSLCFSILHQYIHISQFQFLHLSLSLSFCILWINKNQTNISFPQPHCFSYHSIVISLSVLQTKIGSLAPLDPNFSAKIFLNTNAHIHWDQPYFYLCW